MEDKEHPDNKIVDRLMAEKQKDMTTTPTKKKVRKKRTTKKKTKKARTADEYQMPPEIEEGLECCLRASDQEALAELAIGDEMVIHGSMDRMTLRGEMSLVCPGKVFRIFETNDYGAAVRRTK